jgi:ATP-binding cassette subfamily B protein
VLLLGALAVLGGTPQQATLCEVDAMKDKRSRSDTELYRRLLMHVKPCWRGILGLFVLSQLSTPLALLGPLPIQIAVDNAIGGRPLPEWIDWLLPGSVPRSPGALVGVAAALLLVVALLGQLQSLATSLLTTTTAQRLVLQFRTTLFARVQRLSLAYHDTKGSTDSAYRISYDAPAIQFVVIDGALPFITSMIALVAIVFVTVRLDWQLAVVGLAISPFLFLLSHQYRRPLRSKYQEVKALESGALSVVQEALGALRVVKAFGQEDREEQRFQERAQKGVRAQYQLSLYEGWFALLIGLTTAIGTAATLLIGVAHVRAGTLTLGGLLLVMAYLGQMYGPLTTLSRKVASIQGHLASLDSCVCLA